MCMLDRCPLCPGINALKKILTVKFHNSDNKIKINQWQNTDRNTLINQKINIEEFIDFISNIKARVESGKITGLQSFSLCKTVYFVFMGRINLNLLAKKL